MDAYDDVCRIPLKAGDVCSATSLQNTAAVAHLFSMHEVGWPSSSGLDDRDHRINVRHCCCCWSMVPVEIDVSLSRCTSTRRFGLQNASAICYDRRDRLAACMSVVDIVIPNVYVDKSRKVERCIHHRHCTRSSSSSSIVVVDLYSASARACNTCHATWRAVFSVLVGNCRS